MAELNPDIIKIIEEAYRESYQEYLSTIRGLQDKGIERPEFMGLQ